MPGNQISEELNRLTDDGSGYGDPLAKLIDDRKFQMLMKAYETAVDTRKLEIQLFWNRSLFFWGFIASAFIAYATLRRFSSDISVIVACFGFICSIAWSLGNRGGKFWQESWETKVERIEPSVTGAMFAEPEEVQVHKNFWLRGRRFSVSKLTIALSDYTIALWFAVIVWEIFRLFGSAHFVASAKPWAIIIFISCTAIYGVSLLFAGRSTMPPDEGAQQGAPGDAQKAAHPLSFTLKLMNLPEEIVLKIETDSNKDLSGVIVQMKVKAGRKNPYFIYFPKTGPDGVARLSKKEFVGQFKDHWERGLMDYNGTPESADPEVEVSLFNPSWLNENKQLALAWPLLEHEKQCWASREQQYNYMVNNKNSHFSFDTISENLEKTQKIVLRLNEL